MAMDNCNPFHQISGVSFGVYSDHELANLSVFEVTNNQTFDVLGHPNDGGLYDNKLGMSLSFFIFIV